MSMESKINIYICLSILIVLLMIISIFIQVLLMKRVLYFSRESHFISENQDSILNNNVNEVQQKKQIAVDSERTFSSEKKQNTASVGAEDAVLLTEVELSAEVSQVLMSENKVEIQNYSDTNHIKKPVINSVTLIKKNKGDAVIAKSKQIKDKSIIQPKESVAEITILDSKNKELDGNSAQESIVSEEFKDLKVEEKSIEKTDSIEVEQVVPNAQSSQTESSVVSLDEKKSVEVLEPIVTQSETGFIASSNLLLEEKVETEIKKKSSDKFNSKQAYKAISLNQNDLTLKKIKVDNALSGTTVNLPENIAINVDAKKGNYSQLETSKTAYETISLNQSEDADLTQKDKVPQKKDFSESTETLIIQEVVRNSNDSNIVLSKKEVRSTEGKSLKIETSIDSGAGEKFNAEQFFNNQNNELNAKEAIEPEANAVDVVTVTEREKNQSVEQKEGVLKEKKIDPSVDKIENVVEDEKELLPDVGARLNHQDIILFTGVNSDVLVQNLKDPLGDILSFERDVLKSLSGKEPKPQEFVESIKTQKEPVTTEKIKSLKIFDNVVKKLTSNHQPETELSVAKNMMGGTDRDITFDDIRDTYQKIFNAYK